MTMVYILDEGVMSLSFRLEGAIRTRRPSTSGEEGRHRRKGNRDQRCYVWHLDGLISFHPWVVIDLEM
jgi:hypothetical protein